MGYSYLPSNTVRGKAHPWTSRVPSTGTQDMSSEVAKIAGDAVEAAAQEMRWWRFFFRDIFLGLCQTHTIHVFCLFTYIWWIFFMVHVGIYIYIIHAMGKGAIGKPWKLHMNISKIIPYFLEGMRKWWESELMQVDVYKSMGICLARDCTWAWSPPRKGGRFGRIQLGLAGMLAHHSSLPASHPRCVTVTGRGGQPQVSTPAKTKLAVGF